MVFGSRKFEEHIPTNIFSSVNIAMKMKLLPEVSLYK